ncbi:RCC1 and BTB domain-containing protein 2-like [Dermatophagoides pteronyssinus]|uniref:RCC1 and BTB domain-containing protein 2-like n=1 Tax=Dermatophagoides pteronyssinus TaxID=6956 RepID=UPI003F662948
MKKIPTDTDVDIELFQNDLKDIDPEFIPSIVSIFKITNTNKKFSYLFMTNDNTYGYGDELCKWLSLQHDPKRPQQIDILNDKKIIQVDSGDDFVVVLTDDRLVYLASDKNSPWQTNNNLRLISDGNDRFEMIACGCLHFLLLRQDGTVFALGDNCYGVLTGNSDSHVTLVNTGLNNVKIIACGGFHNLALTNTNEIYSWGYNNYGQLGLGDTNNRTTPSLVSFPDVSINSKIKNIVAGGSHSLFLWEDGQIFICGYGKQPNNDNEQNAKVPTKIPIENVQSIACKNYHNFSFALDQSSCYYVWGRGKNDNSLPMIKLDDQLDSFAAASVSILIESPITFGLTSTINTYESNDPLSFIEFLDNPDNYDIEFIIGDKRILACKCYLKMSSEYYNRMFSGVWQENTNRVMIDAYSYDVYYSYLRMLHTGQIQINQFNIAEFIDLANCYGDEQLMKHCQIFIEKFLNKSTISTYLSLIIDYELYNYEMISNKLLIFKNILSKFVNDNLSMNSKNFMNFLEWFSKHQQQQQQE